MNAMMRWMMVAACVLSVAGMDLGERVWAQTGGGGGGISAPAPGSVQSISVISPKAGEKVAVGSTYIIRWELDPAGAAPIPSAYFAVRLSIDGGVSFIKTLAEKLPADTRKFEWRVSELVSEKAVIEVVLVEAPPTSPRQPVSGRSGRFIIAR